MTTPNLGLALAAAPDTIAQALITKGNANLSLLDTIIGNKVDKGAALLDLVAVASAAGTNPLVAKGTLAQTGDLFQARNNVDTVLTAIKSDGRVNIGTSTDLGAVLGIQSSGVSSVPLRIKGFASQSANLFEAQNSAGTALLSADSAGVIRLLQNVSDGNSYLNWSGTYANKLKGNGATATPLLIQGVASQSATLQEWQNSGSTVLASVDPLGIILGSYIAAGPSRIANSMLSVSSDGNAGRVLAIIRGMAGQTGNLLQIENSAGTLMSGNDSAGRIIYGPGSDISAAALSTYQGTMGFLVNGVVRRVPYYA